MNNDHASSPLVTMCVPVYNHEHFVVDSVRSIIEQTYQNIELIIIDDGSTDRSAEKVASLIDECEARFTRFRFVSRPNKGLSGTLNDALQWATGTFFSALASDDILYPTKTEVLVKHMMENPKCVASFGSVSLIDDQGIERGFRKSAGKHKFDEIFLLKTELPAPASMVVLQAIIEAGSYNPEVKIEDWDMWMRLTIGNDKFVEVLPDLLAKYRMHPANTMKQHDLVHDGLLLIVKQHKTHPLYNRVLCILNCVRFRNLATGRKKEALGLLAKLLMNPDSYREPRLYQGVLYLLLKW